MRRSEPKVLVHSSNGRRFTAVGFFRHVPEMRKSAETVGFLTDRTDRPGYGAGGRQPVIRCRCCHRSSMIWFSEAMTTQIF